MEFYAKVTQTLTVVLLLDGSQIRFRFLAGIHIDSINVEHAVDVIIFVHSDPCIIPYDLFNKDLPV